MAFHKINKIVILRNQRGYRPLRPPPVRLLPPRPLRFALRFVLQGSQYHLPSGGMVNPKHARWNFTTISTPLT